MTTTIEQQLADLIRKHGLLNISITATVRGAIGSEIAFYSSAQAPNGEDRWCAGNDGWDSAVGVAISGAISNLNAKRYAVDVPDAAPIVAACS